jgi:hypothetical protein
MNLGLVRIGRGVDIELDDGVWQKEPVREGLIWFGSYVPPGAED